MITKLLDYYEKDAKNIEEKKLSASKDTSKKRHKN